MQNKKRKMDDKQDSRQKIVQQELFEMRNIPESDWADTSKSSDYVPESTPSSDNIPSECQPKKNTKRSRKKWVIVFIGNLKKIIIWYKQDLIIVLLWFDNLYKIKLKNKDEKLKGFDVFFVNSNNNY